MGETGHAGGRAGAGRSRRPAGGLSTSGGLGRRRFGTPPGLRGLCPPDSSPIPTPAPDREQERQELLL